MQTPPINPAACGEAHGGGPGPGGVFSSHATTYIKPGYSTDADYLEFLIGHELGSLLGLMNTENCTSPNSIMNPGQGCNTLVTPTGNLPTTPQPSDALPVDDTVYGPGSQNVCG